MITTIAKDGFRKSLWKNGCGVSWEVAETPSLSGAELGWRLSIAEIAENVPFSLYGPVDRWFTLIEGNGLTLSFPESRSLTADRLHEPHFFACDVPAECTLLNGPCKALNLFTARGEWTSKAAVYRIEELIEFGGRGLTLIAFGLRGDSTIAAGGMVSILKEGTAAVLEADHDLVCLAGRNTLAYVATLRRL